MPPQNDAKTWPLCTNAELHLGDRVLGEVEQNSFIAGPQTRSPGQLVLKRPKLSEAFRERFIKTG